MQDQNALQRRVLGPIEEAARPEARRALLPISKGPAILGRGAADALAEDLGCTGTKLI